MKLRKHAGKQQISAEKNESILFYDKRTKRYRKRDRNIPISFYNKQTKRYRKRKRNVPTPFYSKRMELYLKREENAENKAKTTLYLQDVEEESVSWCDLNKASILDKAAACALFAFFCISVLLG